MTKTEQLTLLNRQCDNLWTLPQEVDAVWGILGILQDVIQLLNEEDE